MHLPLQTIFQFCIFCCNSNIVEQTESISCISLAVVTWRSEPNFYKLFTTKAILFSKNFLAYFLTWLMPFHCAPFLTSPHPPAAKLLLLLVWHSGKCSEKEKLIILNEAQMTCFNIPTANCLDIILSHRSYTKTADTELYNPASNVLSPMIISDHHNLYKDVLCGAVKKWDGCIGWNNMASLKIRNETLQKHNTEDFISISCHNI